MDVNSLVITILTSTVVSGTLTVILKTYFKARIDNHYKTELERYKSELYVQAEEANRVVSRRFEVYPKIIELIYRTRNMSRDLSLLISIDNLSLVEELISRAKELEDSLYCYRIDLERDGQFEAIHSYKTSLQTFVLKASNVKYFLEQGEKQRAQYEFRDLKSIYPRLEEIHEVIIKKFRKEEHRSLIKFDAIPSMSPQLDSSKIKTE